MARSSAPGFLVSFLVLIAGLLLAFTVGRYPVNLSDLFAVISAKLTGHTPNVPAAVENVIWQVRGPRIVAAILVGAALAVAGVVIGALLGAGVGLIKYLADPYNQLPAMTFWLLGSLAATGPSDLIPLFGPVVLGTLTLFALRWRMNVMSLPDEEARALGASTGPLRIAIVAAATLVTSASVATAGIIGWVGLVVPHIARTLVGPDFGRLIPAAALIGGGFLLLIDTLARTAAAVEIPLGILTALVGTPFFIWLLASMSKTWSVE